MKNLAQRFARAHAESVERYNRRQPAECCDCGDPCEYDPEHDASLEEAKCNPCLESEMRAQLLTEDDGPEPDYDAMMTSPYSEDALDGVRW